MSNQSPNRLYLLDAYALIFRAYYAFIKSPRINSKGFNTSAIFGFANTVLDVLNKEKPTHIGVAFDPPGGTFRSEQFEAYKANRAETPEDIKASVPYIFEFLNALGIPILIKEGFEADDVIGTLAQRAAAQDFEVYIMTSDKDLGQLVTDKIFIYKPASFGKEAHVLRAEDICERYQIKEPKQIIDILGLMGDSVDNIPGIPGVGEKTAFKLVAEYGSMENVLANADNIKGKLGENIRNFAEQGKMSYELATIHTQVPIDFDPDSLLLSSPNHDKITNLFTELEFRSMIKRVLGEEATLFAGTTSGQMSLFGNTETIDDQRSAYAAFKTFDKAHVSYQHTTALELIIKLLAQQEVCFDTETDELDAHQASLVGLSFSWVAGEAWYVPVSKENEKQVLETLRPFFENHNIKKIGQNLKYDMNVLAHYGIKVLGPLFDTMVAHYLLHPESKHGMDYLAEQYLGYTPVSIEKLIGKKGKQQGSMRDVPLEQITEYACEDADVTLQLKEVLAPLILGSHLENLSQHVEMPLIRVLSSMESEGINIDTSALQAFGKELEIDIISEHEKIHALAGVPFNIDSPKQLGEVLFDHLKIDAKAKKTKTGQYATNEDVLSTLTDKHDIVKHILEYRGLRKLKNTYVDPLPELVNARTGRIHTTYLQTVAATGRLSSNQPNLQNIPIKTEKGRYIRKAFIPRNDDFLILSADYSQIELRIIAALAKDEFMIEAFRNGEDIHASTAARVFGVSLDQVNRDMRSKAKAVNFGIIYGQTAFGLSQTLGISRTEAKDIIDNYFGMFPRIQSYISESIEQAKQKGYAETIMGRRRHLPDIHSANQVVRGQAERNAINAPIQGSAADIIKIAMISVWNALEEHKLQSKLLLQVHDELVLDMHKSERETVLNLLKTCMEQAVSLDVPLVVEMNAAENWLEAH